MRNPFKLSSIDVAASNGHAVSRASGGPVLGYVRAGIRGGKQVYLWSDTNSPARDVAAWHDIGATAEFPSIAHALHAFLDVAPPAAPVASDPVPADVPCYLAVSTDAAGVETVLGVFRVADHASPQAAEREAFKLCDRIRAAAPLASYGTRWSNGKGGAPAMVPQVAQQQQAFAGFSVYQCQCGRRSNSLLCLSCLDRDIAADRAAREDGKAARAAGLSEGDNPHAERGRRESWRMGWNEGAPAMVPQPCQQQQANAAPFRPVHFAENDRGRCEVREADGSVLNVGAHRDAASALRSLRATHEVREVSQGVAWIRDRASDTARVMVPQPCQPQQGQAAPNGFYAFQAAGESRSRREKLPRTPEPRIMGPQERDGITPRTIQAQTVQIRTRAEWYAFHHACRHLARQRMIGGRGGETFIPANICGRMHRLDVSRLSISYRKEGDRVRRVTNGSHIALKASMISARPRRALIAFELDYAAQYRRNAAADARNGNKHHRKLSVKAARASIAEARTLATNFNRLPE